MWLLAKVFCPYSVKFYFLLYRNLTASHIETVKFAIAK